MYEKLFEPIDVGPVTIPNRIVRSAHSTALPLKRLIAYHEARAVGGVGMSTLEATGVHLSSPAMRSIIPLHDDAVIPFYKELSDALRPHGMKILQQIYHPGSARAPGKGTFQISASAIPNPIAGGIPTAMTIPMIEEMIEAFASAARRCRDGGLDGIDIHASSGYLIEQFLSPANNIRTDRYGGSLENRMRFLMEIIEAIREEVGTDICVGIRLPNEEYIPGGLTAADNAEIAKIVEPHVDYISLHMGSYWRFHKPAIEPGDPDRSIFSGNCFINNQGEATMLYHGVGAGNCIATSSDPELDDWVKLESNPIIPIPAKDSPEGKLYSSWDPHGWTENGEHLAIFGGPNPALFRAQNLEDWEYVGPFLANNMPDVGEREDVSCPDFFKLGDKYALLCISHNRGARIYLGEWRDNQFHPEVHQRMNFPGGTCFAPESLLDDKGRRIMWAWILERNEPLHITEFTNPPSYGWSGFMSLPRVLSLGDDGTLLIEPVEELERLRLRERQELNIEVSADNDVCLDSIAGNTLEIELTIDRQDADVVGLKVCASPNAEEQTLIEYSSSTGQLSVDVEKSTLDKSIEYYYYTMLFGRENPVVTKQVAPLELKPGEKLELRIFIDRSVIELSLIHI